MTPLFFATVAAGLGGALAVRDPTRRLRRISLSRATGAAGRRLAVAGEAAGFRRRMLGLTAAGLIVALCSLALLGPVSALSAGLVAAELARRGIGARRQRRADHLRAAVPEFCSALAAELAAGRTSAEALAAAAHAAPRELGELCRPLIAAGVLGGDLATGLRAVSTTPGAHALAHVAVCWAVTAELGAGTATALQRLAEGLRAEAHGRAQAETQLAGARATGRMLVLLPVFGVLLGTAVGAAPLGFLLHEPAGGACLLLAVVLDLAGLAWIDRLSARVLAR